MSIKKRIKEFLYSKNCPDQLSFLYFKIKNKEKKKRLTKVIETQDSLLNAIPEPQRDHWKERIRLALSSDNNSDIPRIPGAGTIANGYLVMHNGLMIDPLSYYGLGMTQMLAENQGVHEPQEEYIFQEVLRDMNGNPNPTMLELGAYWSFYSMWLKSRFADANCYMVEPNKENLFYGKKNFRANRLKGTFFQDGIGGEVSKDSTTVDQVCKSNRINFLDILHSDIQGFEVEMLTGSKEMLSSGKVGYVFISTHSNDLHNECRNILLGYDFLEVASADLDESFSWDGILVMRHSKYEGVSHVEIAKRKRND